MKPIKLPRNTVPNHSSLDEFICSGPVATEDGQFEGTKLADLMSFDQTGDNDKNRYYHACICTDKQGKFYVYYQWGRLGVTSDFQFIECESASAAEQEYCKQLHSKNDKRGEWVDLLGKKVLKAKPGKDLYLVRPQVSRKCGLPNAATITNSVKSISSKNCNHHLDEQSAKLLQDLNIGAVEYTRSNMIDTSIPTQEAINEARDILNEITKGLNKNTNTDDLIKILYSRIPKKIQRKQRIVADANLVATWNRDLDAYEAAINSMDSGSSIGDLPFKIKWVDPKSDIGRWIYTHFSCSTLNRHAYISRSLTPINIWEIERPTASFKQLQKQIRKTDSYLPIHQPDRRVDISDSEAKIYKEGGTFLLFHGLRSVNVSGVLTHGFRLPKELPHGAVNGSVFGAAHYEADDVKKSYGYTSAKNSYWNRGDGLIATRKPFMFISDVILGNCFVPKGSTSNLPGGYNTIFAKAGETLKLGGYLENNEFVVFNTNQVNIRYLVEFE